MKGLSRNTSWFLLSPVLWVVLLFSFCPCGIFLSVCRQSLITLTYLSFTHLFFFSFSVSIFSCFVFCLYAMPRRSLWTASCLQERWVSAAFLCFSFPPLQPPKCCVCSFFYYYYLYFLHIGLGIESYFWYWISLEYFSNVMPVFTHFFTFCSTLRALWLHVMIKEHIKNYYYFLKLHAKFKHT